MFGDLLNKIDLGDVLEKVGLSEDQKNDVKNQAADALKYRANKEVARGNKGIMENLFSSGENTEEANGVAKKLEEDLAFNLKNKSNLDTGIIDQIKSAVMGKFVSGFQQDSTSGSGIMGLLADSNLLGSFKDKLTGFFK